MAGHEHPQAKTGGKPLRHMATDRNAYKQVTTSINYDRNIFYNQSGCRKIADECWYGQAFDPYWWIARGLYWEHISHPRIRTLTLDGRTQNQEAIMIEEFCIFVGFGFLVWFLVWRFSDVSWSQNSSAGWTHIKSGGSNDVSGRSSGMDIHTESEMDSVLDQEAIMAIWNCSVCEKDCTVQRDSQFKPHRCIYDDVLGCKKSHWKPVHLWSPHSKSNANPTVTAMGNVCYYRQNMILHYVNASNKTAYTTTVKTYANKTIFRWIDETLYRWWR